MAKLLCDCCKKDITNESFYITKYGEICKGCRTQAYRNYLEAHGFNEAEGWDDDYHAENFSKNWTKYLGIKEVEE